MPKRILSIKRSHKKECDESSSDDDDTIDPTKLPLKQVRYAPIDMIDNHIYFRTDVTMETVGELASMIVRYNEILLDLRSRVFVVTVLPLYIHITSGGGDLMGGFMGYDHIKNSQIPVYTVTEGYAYSSASMMFMAGKKRLMTKNSYLLAHELSQTSCGNSKYYEIMDDAKNITEMMDRIYHLYIDNVRYNRENVSPDDVLTKEKLEAHMLHDLTWNYDDCVRYGLVDGEYINSTTSNDSDKLALSKKEPDEMYVLPPNKSVYVPSKDIIKKIVEINKEKAQEDENDENIMDQLTKYVATSSKKVPKKKKK